MLRLDLGCTALFNTNPHRDSLATKLSKFHIQPYLFQNLLLITGSLGCLPYYEKWLTVSCPPFRKIILSSLTILTESSRHRLRLTRGMSVIPALPGFPDCSDVKINPMSHLAMKRCSSCLSVSELYFRLVDSIRGFGIELPTKWV